MDFEQPEPIRRVYTDALPQVSTDTSVIPGETEEDGLLRREYVMVGDNRAIEFDRTVEGRLILSQREGIENTNNLSKKSLLNEGDQRTSIDLTHQFWINIHKNFIVIVMLLHQPWLRHKQPLRLILPSLPLQTRMLHLFPGRLHGQVR